MSETQYYKTVQLTIYEHALIYQALGEKSDQILSSLLARNLPEFQADSMKIEYAAVQSAMHKFAAAKTVPA